MPKSAEMLPGLMVKLAEMRKLRVIPVLKSIARRAHLDSAARFANRKRLLIVTYHGLREDASPHRHWLLLPLSEFARQMQHLRSHYNVVRLDDAIRELDTESVSEPRACITFDDGYRSNLDLALPVLRELGLPATIFLPTGLIGTTKLLWTTRVDLGLQKADAAARQQIANCLGLTARLNSPHFAFLVSDTLKTMRPDRRDEMLDRFDAFLPPVSELESKPFEFLTWSDVGAMEATNLISFGAHTVNHEIVRNLDDQALREEIRGSLDALAQRCQRSSRVFAYPNGREVDFDDRAARILEQSGCAAAVSTIEGLNRAGTPRYALRRISIGAELEFSEFRLKVSGFDAHVRRLIRRA